VLANLARQSRKGVLAVSGTNGKSTTAGFISSILGRAKYKLAHNRQGANLVSGITASLIDAASWTGTLDTDYCLFEIDEAALPVVAKEVVIDNVVVTNLFRDQLDRFGELDTTASLIDKGIKTNNSRAFLNADDPNVARLAPDSERVFYGIESVVAGTESAGATSGDLPAAGVQELSYCIKCGNEYSYAVTFYGQLGHYICKACGHQRPQPDVKAANVVLNPGGSTFDLVVAGRTLPIELRLPGLFNVYNSLAAATLAFKIGVSDELIRQALADYSTLFGRSERLQLNGKTVLIQLIKNPAGASQAVRAAVTDPHCRILVAINDNYADGRDVSWLWDAEFELLAQNKKRIFVSGIRCDDMAVRLKYAGIPDSQIVVVPQMEQALMQALEATGAGETLWILPTYTCLLSLQKIARSMGTHLSGT
jgi:UDP-N-acetylmuramyl tripeptide synthase